VKRTQFSPHQFRVIASYSHLTLGLLKTTLDVLNLGPIKSLGLLKTTLDVLNLGLVKSLGLLKTTLDVLNLGLVKSTLVFADGDAFEKMEKFTISMSHESI